HDLGRDRATIGPKAIIPNAFATIPAIVPFGFLARYQLRGLSGSAMTIALKPKDTARVAESRAEHSRFERFARMTSFAMGRPAAFLAAFATVMIWAVSGPFFHYSDTWQLAINTGTTVVTFLMVFLIQQSQNRDTLAVQVKLAELIIAVKGAHNAMATVETLSEQQLQELHDDYRKRADETLRRLETYRALSMREALKMEAEPPPV